MRCARRATLSRAVRIYLATGGTDLRRSIDGLAALVRERFDLDPLSGHLFLFRSRPVAAHRDRLAEADKQCPCGGTRTRIGEDVAEKLEYEPARFVIVETARLKYACQPQSIGRAASNGRNESERSGE